MNARGQSDDEPPRRQGASQPLRASWQPSGRGRPRRRGVAALVSRYGWRIYALPVLAVLTVLVLTNTVGKDAPGAQAAGDGTEPNGALAAPTQSSSGPPVVTEHPSSPVDVNVPSAELPPGGTFTQTGAGSWHVVPGKTDRVGTGGKLFTYTVEIEDGIDPATYGGDDAFGKLIDQTLADPRGWTGDGKVSVQRVDSGTPTMRISLSSPDTVHRPDMCGYEIKYETSCFRRSAQRVMINEARWVRGAVAFSGDMVTYRQYAINHEVGHAFNNSHVGCPADGALAPVMMQQTFGVANNFIAELNKAVKNKDPVVADGKACKPNAWPNPQAKH